MTKKQDPELDRLAKDCGGNVMNYEDILKVWHSIESLDETKAKLALLGLVIKQHLLAGEPLEGVSAELIKAAKTIRNAKE